MNPADLILTGLAVLGASAFLFRLFRRKRKKSGCCGCGTGKCS